MATLVINDINDDVVNIFRELANKFGAKTQVIESNATLVTDKLASNQALQEIPQSDNNDDIFTRKTNINREIDWQN